MRDEIGRGSRRGMAPSTRVAAHSGAWVYSLRRFDLTVLKLEVLFIWAGWYTGYNVRKLGCA